MRQISDEEYERLKALEAGHPSKEQLDRLFETAYAGWAKNGVPIWGKNGARTFFDIGVLAGSAKAVELPAITTPAASPLSADSRRG